MKRILSATIVCFFMLSFLMGAVTFAATEQPDVEAESAILIDMTTGTVLYEKNPDTQLYPASTTKMITCLLAIENLNMDDVITVDAEVASTEGNSIDLVVGEQMTVKDMLYAMMTESANDCAVALAKAVSGSTGDFAVLMNSRAAELGAKNTHFVNPNGLHKENHLSTAADLAAIARGCMANDLFRDMVSRATYTVPATNKSKQRALESTNYLLADESASNRVYVGGVLRNCKYEGTIGIKTGYTSKALGCLVSAVERDDTTLLAVVLKSSNLGRFADSMELYDWGFANYKTVAVEAKGASMGTVKVKRGEFNNVGVVVPVVVAATVPIEASSALLTTEVRMNDSVKAPVSVGQEVGTVALLESGNEIATFPVVAAASVAEGGPLSVFGIEDKTAALMGKIFLIAIALLFLALVVYIIVKRRETKIKKARRAERLRRQRAEEDAKRTEWEKMYESKYNKRDTFN